MSNKETDFTQAAKPTDAEVRAETRASLLLRLLHSRPSGPIRDQDLREEFQRLYDLLKRIDELAEDELRYATITSEQQPDPEPEPDEAPEPYPAFRPAWQAEPEPEAEPELVPFDPSELETFESFEPHFAGVSDEQPARDQDSSEDDSIYEPKPIVDPQPESVHDPAPASAPEPDTTPDEAMGDENPQRWWVSFNGDVSLDRLARLRKTLSESPFTIEARFDEITDGLIVLRVVTERQLTMEQVDWIVKQVMQGVGLDRNAALISRN